MKMDLCGMTEVRQGISKKDGKEYMSCDLHFIGRTSSVEGVTVAKVYVDLMAMRNPPPLQIGNTYDLDLTDKGYLRNLELLAEKAENAAPKDTAKDELKDGKKGGES